MIRVLNILHDYQSFPHKLIYVAGEVDHDRQHAASTWSIHVLQHSNETDKSPVDHQESVWNISDGRFKCFVELERGENEICLTLYQGEVRSKIQHILHCRYEPVISEYKVKFVYVTCKDSTGEFQDISGKYCSLDRAINKIRFNSLLCQLAFSENLVACGIERCALALDEVEVFESQLSQEESMSDEFLEKNGKIFWYFYQQMKEREMFNGKTKIVGVLGCTRYCFTSADDVDEGSIRGYEYIRCHTAATYQDLALIGGGGLYAWAENVQELAVCMRDSTAVPKTSLFDDSAGRGTYGGVYSTTLGSMFHELGHALDLDHTVLGIMGRGFDDVMCFVLPDRNLGIHLTPCEREMPWWYDWGGAMFHPASVSLLKYHIWNNWYNQGVRKECEMKCYECCDFIEVGEPSLTETCSKFSLNLTDAKVKFLRIYSNGLYLTGISVEDEVCFGEKTETYEEVKITSGSRLIDVEVNAGAVIDGVSLGMEDTISVSYIKVNSLEKETEDGIKEKVKYEEETIREKRTSKWIGGGGGQKYHIFNEDGFTVISGTIGIFGPGENMICITSLNFERNVDNLEEKEVNSTKEKKYVIKIQSTTDVIYIVLRNGNTDQIWYYKDFLVEDTRSEECQNVSKKKQGINGCEVVIQGKCDKTITGSSIKVLDLYGNIKTFPISLMCF